MTNENLKYNKVSWLLEKRHLWYDKIYYYFKPIPIQDEKERQKYPVKNGATGIVV